MRAELCTDNSLGTDYKLYPHLKGKVIVIVETTNKTSPAILALPMNKYSSHPFCTNPITSSTHLLLTFSPPNTRHHRDAPERWGTDFSSGCSRWRRWGKGRKRHQCTDYTYLGDVLWGTSSVRHEVIIVGDSEVPPPSSTQSDLYSSPVATTKERSGSSFRPGTYFSYLRLYIRCIPPSKHLKCQALY